MKWWNYKAKLASALHDKELIEREVYVLKKEIEDLYAARGSLSQENNIERSKLLKTRADVEIASIKLGRLEQEIGCAREWAEND